jgi:RNA polymerase sigma-70 factor (ECF subfamily)
MSTLQTDYELAQAVSHGAVSCLADLYERHSRKVFALCLRMTGDVCEAEDLTQDVFIQLLHKVGTFRGEGQFTTWLYRLTTNQVLMHMRSPIRRREFPSMLDELANTLVVKRSFGRQLTDRLTLAAALRQLPSGYRSVFLKYDVEGYNHQEIAGIFGCSVGNSKSQLHKARRKLRKLLAINRGQNLRTPIKRIGLIP